jgi:hypothetical protein
MKYATRADTFRVRQVTPAELAEAGETTVPAGEGEFQVKVSPVGNGWWTRAELTALRDKLSAELDRPVPVTRNDQEAQS